MRSSASTLTRARSFFFGVRMARYAISADAQGQLENHSAPHYSSVNYGDDVQIYKTKIFARFLRRENVSDASLIDATYRANQGLIDADLGGGLIKQRVARPGQGRSGGYRTILLFRAGDIAIFLAGFAKSERANITDDDLEDLKTIAKQWLTDPKRIEKDLAAGILNEVQHDNEG